MKPKYIFETSWEVCNKVGGIHTVLATKSKSIKDKIGNNLILFGPDIWHDKTNNEFIEDKELFADWRNKIKDNQIKIRVGYWNIPAKPIVILVDFTPYFQYKNEIFAHFWEEFKLDSISGNWDYVEPAMFGYAVGAVIRNFVSFNSLQSENVVAQFHEWMTGLGILYLKEYAPHVTTAFTTHATVLGRSIAGNGLPLYREIENFKTNELVKQFNVTAKFSLEKLSAIESDVFTTVSDITAVECLNFFKKKVDIVTPNGFDEFLIPKTDEWKAKTLKTRAILEKTAELITKTKPEKNDLFIVTSGRYEYKNKGLDLFLDALYEINKTETLTKKIFAFIMVPAGIYGPINNFYNALYNDAEFNLETEFLTHKLLNPDYDPIINKLRQLNFSNYTSENVKIVFVPSYLDGVDGAFNIKYYDLLSAFDASIFASYYEPWGYTPLESLAFNVPTVTTSLAGFGKWVQQSKFSESNAVKVINRTDDNDSDVVTSIKKYIIDFSKFSKTELEKAKINAGEISKTALWSNLAEFYFKAYEIAIENKEKRFSNEDILSENEKNINEHIEINFDPKWRSVYVESNYHEKFNGLFEMSENLWWSWNFNFVELFKKIDRDLWVASNYNPKLFLNKLPFSTLDKFAKDKEFMKEYETQLNVFNSYVNKKAQAKGPNIAYFSMEYGFHDALKIFSGGLGILAGDYLKEASDNNVNLTAVGLLYKYGYFKQELSIDGQQIAKYEAQMLSQIPVSKIKNAEGQQIILSVKFPGRDVKIKLWKAIIGRIDLILLDTDFDDNIQEDREITYHLYGGNNENRLKQEIILGIGGITTLCHLGIYPEIFHLNEGHAAFIGLERINKLMYEKYFTYQQAVEIIRSTSLFTTHTPVPAGHDMFEENLMRKYISYYYKNFGITWEEFFALGKAEKTDFKFSMSNLALHLSQEVNGVSRLHGDVTKKMFNPLWKGYFTKELPIGYVTNGVHFATWTSKYWKKIYDKISENKLIENQDKIELWNNIQNLDDAIIWDTRNHHREKLINYLKLRIQTNWVRRYDNPKLMIDVVNSLNNKALTIGFARRFATYKRALLLFSDLERLSKIVNNPKRPVQFIFAGKAHPNDIPGQSYIKDIVEISKRPEFIGKILFVENYDMELARKLVQGVDIWFNTPTRPLEASGTSGMKAVMNGALHFSVLDGWWAEGYMENAGWSLPEERTFEDQNFQNQLDASLIYHQFENEIIPTYYNRNENDVPVKWVSFIKNSISKVASNFTTKRMIDNYYNRFYNKLYSRFNLMSANNYEKLKEFVIWKNGIGERFSEIKVLKITTQSNDEGNLKLGENTIFKVTIDKGSVDAKEIGLQIVISYPFIENNEPLSDIVNFELYKEDGQIVKYKAEVKPNELGKLNYGIRLFPISELQAYQQDSGILRWL